MAQVALPLEPQPVEEAGIDALAFGVFFEPLGVLLHEPADVVAIVPAPEGIAHSFDEARKAHLHPEVVTGANGSVEERRRQRRICG